MLMRPSPLPAFRSLSLPPALNQNRQADIRSFERARPSRAWVPLTDESAAGRKTFGRANVMADGRLSRACRREARQPNRELEGDKGVFYGLQTLRQLQ